MRVRYGGKGGRMENRERRDSDGQGGNIGKRRERKREREGWLERGKDGK